MDSLFCGQEYLNEGTNKQLQLVPFLTRLIPEAGHMTTGLRHADQSTIPSTSRRRWQLSTYRTGQLRLRGWPRLGRGVRAFNVPKGTRVKRFEEYLELVQRLWSEESVTHHSDTCILDNVRMNIRPVQQPGPPIWFAANNDKAIRRAARMGDNWFINPHSTLDTIRRQMVIYRDELKAEEKDFPRELPIIKEIFCAGDRATAAELAGPYLLGKYRDYAKWGQDDAMPDDESFDKDFEELTSNRFVLGSPEECYEQLQPYWRELGVSHLILRTHWAGMPADTALDSMRLISEELLPELHKL